MMQSGRDKYIFSLPVLTTYFCFHRLAIYSLPFVVLLMIENMDSVGNRQVCDDVR